MQQSKRRTTITVQLQPKIARELKKRAKLNDQTVGEAVNQLLSQLLVREVLIVKLVRERQARGGYRPLAEVLEETGLGDLVQG